MRAPSEPRISEDLACVGCGHNLRGLPASSPCPECGRPIRDTLEGQAVEASNREHAAEAIRSYGKSFLYGAPFGLFKLGCLGPLVSLVAMFGSVQRLIAANQAIAMLPEQAGSATVELRRARTLAFAELATGVPALLLLSFSTAWLVGDTADAFLRMLATSAWFGTMALGLVTGWMFVDSTVVRLALSDCERRSLPAYLALGAVPCTLVAEVLLSASLLEPLAIVMRVAAALLWAGASAMLAYQGSAAGDEVAGGPRRRKLKTPEDAEDAAPSTDARASAQSGRTRTVRRPPPPRPPEDDDPIPLD